MSDNRFYKPEDIRSLYSEIVPVYQAAFAVEPWNEVSKCADKQMRCVGGLSALTIGSLCDTCGLCPNTPAYGANDLTERFDALGLSRPTAWYAEQNDQGLTMAAVAWRATPSDIAKEKYDDVPKMNGWMKDTLGDEPVMWLDEVFANKQLKAQGNLQNFSKFVVGLVKMLDCNTVAYRTVEPRMTVVPKRDFGDYAKVLLRKDPVPDRRDFVIISNVNEVV